MCRDVCVKGWRTYRKYFVVVGGILIYFPIGVPWYFGNLATYLTSYIHATDPSQTDLVKPEWIFSMFFVFFSAAITASGFLSKRYGARPVLVAACVIHSGATFLSYYAVQHSMLALILTFGAAGGLGAGLAYGPPLPVVIQWLPRRIGLASAVLLTGFGGGAVFYNEIITWFINPTNLRPDNIGYRTNYFSHEVILRKVPQIFILLGCITVVLQTLGVLLLRAPEEGDEVDVCDPSEATPVVTHKTSGESVETCFAKKERSKSTECIAIAMSVSGDLNLVKCPSASNGRLDKVGTEPNGVLQDETPKPRPSYVNITTEVVKPIEVNLSPGEVLRTANFYILWIALAFNHFGYVIKNNFYKEFGQIKINDDHFLTTVGTMGTISASVSRLVWGAAADWIGLKLTMLIFTAMATVLTALWYLTLHVDPWLYLFWTTMVSGALSAAFVLFPISALRSFGEQHYTSNYGMLLTAQVVVNLFAPLITGAILLHLDWFWLFCTIAVLNFLATVILLFLENPEK